MKKEKSVLVLFLLNMKSMKLHEGCRGIVAFSLRVGTPSCTLARASAEADRPAGDSV